MTKARQHLPGQVVLLTRRTEERRYFLRPDSHCRAIVTYQLARAADTAHLSIHGLMAMSNHVHVVATDNVGDRSDFMRDLCAGVARARNCGLDRDGHFWDTQQFGDTVLLDRAAIEEKLLYTWLNPVTANLVERAEHWPGAKILPRDWGKRRVVTAPHDGFYDPKKAKLIVFTPSPPPGFEDKSLDEVIEHFETLLRKAEDKLMVRRRRRGKRVVGVRRLLRLDPFDAPSSRAARRKLNPGFASRNAALMERAQRERRQFHADYDEVNDAWRKGKRDVTFPAGTVRHRRISAVACHAPLGCEASVFRA